MARIRELRPAGGGLLDAKRPIATWARAWSRAGSAGAGSRTGWRSTSPGCPIPTRATRGRGRPRRHPGRRAVRSAIPTRRPPCTSSISVDGADCRARGDEPVARRRRHLLDGRLPRPPPQGHRPRAHDRGLPDRRRARLHARDAERDRRGRAALPRGRVRVARLGPDVVVSARPRAGAAPGRRWPRRSGSATSPRSPPSTRPAAELARPLPGGTSPLRLAVVTDRIESARWMLDRAPGLVAPPLRAVRRHPAAPRRRVGPARVRPARARARRRPRRRAISTWTADARCSGSSTPAPPPTGAVLAATPS